MAPPTIRLLLAPMAAWAAHFFLGYGLALALPASALLDPLIVALTVVMMGLLGLVWRRSAALATHRRIARQTVIIAALAIGWQGLVILF